MQACTRTWSRLWWTSAIVLLVLAGLPSCGREQSLEEHTYALFEARSDPERSLDQLVPNLQRLASDGASLKAHGLLALCHFYGIGTAPDRRQAETHAALGKSDANAAFTRAKLVHVPADPEAPVDQEQIIRLYREAIELGSPHAPNNLARVLADSEDSSAQEIQHLLEVGVQRLDLVALWSLSWRLWEGGEREKVVELLPLAFVDEKYRTISPALEAEIRWLAADWFLRIYLDSSDKQAGKEIPAEAQAALIYLNIYLHLIALDTGAWDLDDAEKHRVAQTDLLALARILVAAEKAGRRVPGELFRLWNAFANQHHLLLDPLRSRAVLEKLEDLDADSRMRDRIRALSRKIVERMEQAATERQLAPLMFDIGAIYHFGYGVANSYRNGFNWFLKAAEGGHEVGMWNVYVGYRDGKGVLQDDEAAATWLRRAADRDYPNAKGALALVLMDGHLGVQPDPAAGAALLRETASSGIPGDLPWRAALELAERLPTAFPDSSRDEVVAQYREAYRLVEQELARTRQDAEAADGRAQELSATGEVFSALLNYLIEQEPTMPRVPAEMLGIQIEQDLRQLVAQGKSLVEKADYEAARALLFRAAMANEPESFYHIGLLYALGGLNAGNDAQARRLARRYLVASAERGISDAQSFLGYYDIYLRLVEIFEIFGIDYPKLFTARYEAELKERDFYEWLQKHPYLTADLGVRSAAALVLLMFSDSTESQHLTTLRQAARELERERTIYTSGVVGNDLILGFKDGRTVAIRPRADAIVAVLRLATTVEHPHPATELAGMVKVPNAETNVHVSTDNSELAVEIASRPLPGDVWDAKRMLAGFYSSCEQIWKAYRSVERSTSEEKR
jgi:TPR repeat protein